MTIDSFRLGWPFAATGTVGLIGAAPSTSTDGDLNIAVASLFTDAVSAEGDTRLQVAVRGTAAAPDLTGFVELANGSFVVDEPDIAAEGVAVRLDLAGRGIALTRLDGMLNGGRLGGSGVVVLGDAGIADISLEVSAADVAFDAPLDLRSVSDANISVVKSGDTFAIGGQVTIDEAGLTGDINFDEGLLAAMTARRQSILPNSATHSSSAFASTWTSTPRRPFSSTTTSQRRR